MPTRLRRTAALVSLALTAAVGALPAGPGQAAPPAESAPAASSRIPLPNGFAPEGIAIRRFPVAFLGSLVDGDIYRANLMTGQGRIVAQGPGTSSVGLKIDRFRRLWVSGGGGGDARVVNPRTGTTVRSYDLGGGFVNDVALINGFAWFTDSFRPVLYRVGVRRPAPLRAVTVPLSGAWQQVPDSFNANGIAPTPDRSAALVVNSATATLYRVDPATGVARRVDLGGYPLTGGDGLLVEGRRLYVVQNQLNQVAVFRLGMAGRSGQLLKVIRARSFDVPTTVASFGDWLYLPNARFGTPVTPTTRYWITRVHQ